MKNKSLFTIVRASLLSNKALSAMFCFFVIISFVLIFLAVGIIVPLGVNIETRLNRHIINREIVIEMSAVVSEEEKARRLKEISEIEGVIDIYENPDTLSVEETDGLLGEGFELDFVHKYFNLTLVSGRTFDESERGVALVPAHFSGYNPSLGVVQETDGSTLIGKTLEFEDRSGNTNSFEVVGTFDTLDPMFTGKEVLVPREELLEIKDEFLEAMPEGMYKTVYSAIVVTDSYKNTEGIYTKIEKITKAYRQKLPYDVESFNAAFFILLGSTAFFVVLTVFGFYMFLKGNVNARTNELALYRAIGFNSKNLFRIISGEHLTLTLLSIVLGTGAFYALAYFMVNPYLYSLLGGTYMEMAVDSNPLFGLAVAVVYVVITLGVTVTAVKRSEKIDLTVLLRE
ncbi:MAG: ABC transporter permease [Clostridia bacterium]|nr:ABC transporter permease [Clostridia bacterium]